ncbi:MAG: CBS domain-containing protein [Candidatus Saccharibacteria bacterium]|nr:CBS domain-containing protein [Candidatus Saccharibacteria bacterium]
MNIILIIILTVLVTMITSVDFHPDHNKAEIKKLGTTGRKAKSIGKFIEIYSGFRLFIGLVSLMSIIWVACLASLEWGLLAGCFIALVVIALAQLLGARLVPLTDQFIINQSSFLVKYLGWTGVFNALVTDHKVDPIDDIPELLEVLHASNIDCPTQLAIEKTLELRTMPVSKLATKWSEVKKLNYKDKLTPVQIDDLFKSRQKIFPVIRNDEDDVVGLLHLADVQTIGQTEKKLLDSMHRNFASCEHNMTVPEALQLMAEAETTVAVVMKNQKVYGLVNLTDIMSVEPVCHPQHN